MVQDHLLQQPDRTASTPKLRFSCRRISRRDLSPRGRNKRKAPPAEPEALLKKSGNDREARRSLRLGGRRLRRGWLWSRRLCRRGPSGLNPISLIVPPDNVLSAAGVRGSKENLAGLRAGIQNAH